MNKSIGIGLAGLLIILGILWQIGVLSPRPTFVVYSSLTETENDEIEKLFKSLAPEEKISWVKLSGLEMLDHVREQVKKNGTLGDLFLGGDPLWLRELNSHQQLEELNLEEMKLLNSERIGPNRNYVWFRYGVLGYAINSSAIRSEDLPPSWDIINKKYIERYKDKVILTDAKKSSSSIAFIAVNSGSNFSAATSVLEQMQIEIAPNFVQALSALSSGKRAMTYLPYHEFLKYNDGSLKWYVPPEEKFGVVALPQVVGISKNTKKSEIARTLVKALLKEDFQTASKAKGYGGAFGSLEIKSADGSVVMTQKNLSDYAPAMEGFVLDNLNQIVVSYKAIHPK